ncbi:DUF1266 domain-containing protein [Geobacter benzoatilyticus]|uniref:DUF1266 domain-containing protein n=1 Tax=Geobacter benzoatilyticus TaxID=2815309 RepID=A0ABX7Q6H4_9BACT|nr:DUF1266 domain-containing protein [Geobacter benzoatilyticus]QSV47053.1 DUF1266 domain-containing protein [Geobacter benzoatilyticus]
MNSGRIASIVICLVMVMTMMVMGGCKNSSSKESSLTESQKWALATSAIPKKANDMKLDVPGGAADVKDLQEMLRSDWEIQDHKTALDAIKFLREQGHREEFNLVLKEISQSNQNEFNQLVSSYANQPEIQKQLQLVYKHKDTVGKKSIIAWDYCRLVYVAECAGRAGYLTEDEAWQEIMAAAKVIQATFTSWEEMGNNYLLGREFWAGSSEPTVLVASKFLLSDQKSPWVKLAWNQPLEETGKDQS